MTTPLPPLDGVELQPTSQVDWARIVSRIRMPDRLLLLAGWICAFAGPDGYVTELDLTRFTLISADEEAVRGMLAALCEEYGLLQPWNCCGVACCRNSSYQLTLPADVTDRFVLAEVATGGTDTRSVE